QGAYPDPPPADLEDVLDRDHGWILGAAEERSIIDGEEPGGAVPAQPVRLTRRCAAGHRPRRLADDGLICAQIDGLAGRALAASEPRGGPAYGCARAHHDAVLQLHRLAGTRLGAIDDGVHLETDAVLNDAIELRALVGDEGIGRQRGEPAADR